MPLDIETILDKPGAAVAVYREGNSCPMREFLNTVTNDERKKAFKLLKRFAEFGEIQNVEQFKKVEGSDGVWEFKPTSMIRLLCFFAENEPRKTVVLTFGLKKKKAGLRREDIERVETLRSQYLEEGRERDD